jgi:hypothetical protein
MEISGKLDQPKFHDNPAVLYHQSAVPYCLIVSRPPRKEPRPPSPRNSAVWLIKADGSNARFLRQEPREVVGLAADGMVILRDSRERLIRWNPVTNTEQVFLPIGGAS